MEIKKFGDKRIKIRKISKGDLKNVKKFQDFINSLIEENAMIQANKKMTIKGEIAWLKAKLDQIKKKKVVTLIAEEQSKIVASIEIRLDWGKQDHVGHYGIIIRKSYRRMGLGTYLTKKILKLAKKELKPPAKIIRLSVYATNKPAIKFYEIYKRNQN